eukprot:CAMPEP_0197317500 /NCGR_PEP_ID=MMETSP0891-20130614/47301_1 /TAXON_ID=44058 ORGANISM="Aureoumbra lagunensis, Strain CCMP1510" /NCGR_SAMPLE_ID=MMETSP0891 /ASSEMBLY_ACC=CAM_ASM_000534 /LENGTH=968 /DNA_ID=CAMNT_0042807517 /DNA_START=122 /DNA_END=3028 /DNA_ORIENTATION=+
MGVMCDFSVVQNELKSLEGDDVLVICDPSEKFGEKFVVCLTREAHDRELKVCQDMQAEREAQEAKEREERARQEEEDRRIANAVYVDKPRIAQKYESASSDETALQVEKLSVQPERALYKYAILRDSTTFGLPCNFGDREADNDKYLEHRSHKNPDFELQRRLKDTYIQVAPNLQVIGTQTKFNQRLINKCTQYDPISQSILNMATPFLIKNCQNTHQQEHLLNYGSNFVGVGTDLVSRVTSQENLIPLGGNEKTRSQIFSRRTNTRNNCQTTNIGGADSMYNIASGDGHHLSFASAKTLAARRAMSAEERLGTFLRRSTPLMEEALQHNESMDIFQDAFWSLLKGTDEESLVATNGGDARAENELKQLRTFNDIRYSKNMSLICVEWHPSLKGMVAVAPRANLSFEQQIAISRLALSTYILLWDFTDLIHPRLVLECPQDIHCFAFNPSQPHYIVAGGSNGQVLLWNIEIQVAQILRRQRRSAAARASGNLSKASSSTLLHQENEEDSSDEDESEETNLPIIPIAVSTLEQTHKRGVVEIYWLPPECQIDYRGQILESTDKMSHQFVTIAGDGQLLFWDVRYKDIAEGKLPLVGRRLAFGAELKPGKEIHTTPWNPLYRVQLKRLEGVGDFTLCKFLHTHTNNDDKNKDRRSEIVCSSEEGEIIVADWRGTNMISKSSDAAVNDEQHTETDAPEYVCWTAPDHTRPPIALEKSPFFDDLVMSIGDYNFQLWKLDACLLQPVYSSPQSTSPLTAGCWSPTRPGVIFTARADGTLDVWDIPDSSRRPSHQLMVAPTRVTALKFLKPQANTTVIKQQLLAVGDKAGNLHVFDVPRSLWRPTQNEKSAIASFLDGEIDRVKYVQQRTQARRKEREARAAKDDASTVGTDTKLATADRTRRSSASVPQESAEFSIDELNAMNDEYKVLQAEFAEMMDIELDETKIPKIITPPSAPSPGAKSIKSAASIRVLS